MKKKLILLLFLILMVACKEKNTSGKITADLSSFKNEFDKVVIDMWGYEQLGDSIKISDTLPVKNGKFEYTFRNPEPKVTSVILLKKNKVIGRLSFKDKHKPKHSFGNIYLGNEEIFIKGKSFKKTSFNGITRFMINCDGAIENDIDESLWGKKVSPKIIRANPNSYAVLHKLFWQKNKFSNKQLAEMMDLFSDDLKEATSFKILRNYLDKKIDFEKNGYAKKFNWQDIDGKTYDFKTALNGKKYALLVFWASWCGPCRAEIPEIKEFHKKYGDKVSIISMSIDDDYNRWKNALEKEQMPWLNLSSLPKSKNAVKKEYNIYAVPNLILLDKNGKMLMNNLNELDKIEDYIK